MFNYKLKKIKYCGKHRNEISMPLGGIGTGCIGLSGIGALVDFEIFNRPSKNSAGGYTFFAVKAEKDSEMIDARVLVSGGEMTYKGDVREAVTKDILKLPHFPECAFEASYPFGEMLFECDEFPGKIHFTGWNPLIPLNDTDSSIPAAFLEYEITNDREYALDYTFYGIAENPYTKGINKFSGSRNEKINYITLKNGDSAIREHEISEMCLGVCGEPFEFCEYICDDGETNFPDNLWNSIVSGSFEKEMDSSKDDRIACMISSRLHLEPGDTGKVRFVISWFTPYCYNYWNTLVPDKSITDEKVYSKQQIEETNKNYYHRNIWKNYYTRYFSDASECAYYCLSQWDRLYEDTDLFRQLLFTSTLPSEILDAVSSGIATLRSTACMRYEDGSLYGFEACSRDGGVGGGNYSPIWQYAYVMPYLFPKIERLTIQNHYIYDADKNGLISARSTIPNGRSHKVFVVSLEGQLCDILRAYREFKLCGDKEWLSSIWKPLVKSLEYFWSSKNPEKWDFEKKGIIVRKNVSNNQFGIDLRLTGIYHAALLSVLELSEVMKDRKHAALFREIYNKGTVTLFKALSETSDISFDDIISQWHSDFTGNGSIFDAILCEAVLNTGKERLLADSCCEILTYEAAAHISMHIGANDGLEIVRRIRQQYDGYKGNPFSEGQEIDNCIKSMSSYTLLGAFSGQRIDVYNKAYKFCPDMQFSEKNVYRCFVCFDGFMGYVERGIDYIQINCVKGRMFVRSIEVPDRPLKVKCGGIEIGFKASGNTAMLDYECEVNEKRDLFVIFRY